MFYQLRLVGWAFQKALLSRDFWVLQLLWKAVDSICQQWYQALGWVMGCPPVSHAGSGRTCHQHKFPTETAWGCHMCLHLSVNTKPGGSYPAGTHYLPREPSFTHPFKHSLEHRIAQAFCSCLSRARDWGPVWGCYSEPFSTFPILVLSLSFSGSWLCLQGDFSCFIIYYLFLQLEPPSLCYWKTHNGPFSLLT